MNKDTIETISGELCEIIEMDDYDDRAKELMKIIKRLNTLFIHKQNSKTKGGK